jgi:aspartate/methionine/tyrosine aminotransferase
MGCLSGFILGFINPGDECVVFEPAFPFFMDDLKIAGGKLKTVPLYLNNH